MNDSFERCILNWNSNLFRRTRLDAMHLARRGGDLEERLDAWYDALRFLEEDPERRAQVEVEMSRAVLAEAKDRGVASAEERRRLIAAAERLERLEKPAEAAAAFELLGRQEDQARCLEAAGEVEALEALLDQTSEEELRASRLRRLLSDAEMAVRYGARAEARAP